MLKGVNIDITNNPPDPDLLVRLHVEAVRFPSRHGIDSYIDLLLARQIYTLAVVDKKSAGLICGGGKCSAYQIHNEVDGSAGASGPLTTDQCIQELRIYRESYPELILIAPGLSAGDYSATYLKAIVSALRDYRYAAVALHPYGKSPSAAVSLATAHRKVDPSFPILFTECHPEAADIRQFHKSARDNGVAGVFHHCWTDAMTLASEGIRYGLVDEHGNHKRELGLWTLS